MISRATCKTILAAALLAGLGLGTSEARADIGYNYCGGLVPAGNWCSGPTRRHTWNRAQYPGSGTVNVGIVLCGGAGCKDQHHANNYVSSGYPFPGYTSVANSHNNDNGKHTIQGHARYTVGTPTISKGPPESAAEVDPGSILERRPEDVATARASLAVLRRVAAEPDVLPEALRSEEAATIFDWDAGAARLAFTRQGADAYYVIPGSQLCLYRVAETGERSGTCVDPADPTSLLLRESGLDDLAEGQMRVIGVALDGITSVRIQAEGGEMQEVPVHDNVFVAELEGDAAQPLALLSYEGSIVDEEPLAPEAAACSTARPGGDRPRSSAPSAIALAALGAIAAAVARRRYRDQRRIGGVGTTGRERRFS